METETITTYEQSKSKHFVDTMDGTFKENEPANDTNNCSAVRDDGASAYMEESHTDDEEDVRLNLDCSKSDDDDDLGEASDNENNTETDLTGDQNRKDEIQIDKSNEKVLEDLDNIHTDDKEELQSSDTQNKGKSEKDTTKDADENYTDDKQQVDDEPAESDHGEIDNDNSKTITEVKDVAMEEGDSQNEKNPEGKNEGEPSLKDDSDGTEVKSKGDQNTKEVDTSNEKLLEDLDKNHADKEEVQGSDNQANMDEIGKDTTKGTDGSHNGVQHTSSNGPESKMQVDDPDKADNHESNGDKTKTVSEVEGDTVSKEGSQNKEDAEKSKNEEETPEKDQKTDADVESKDDSKKNDKEGDKYSLLKETLSKPSEETKEQENNEEEMDEDFDPSDFDPSLLCPEVAMEVDEAPVISPANDPQNNDDGPKSPILFDAVFSTYVDEMTGTETCFDLTPEEDKLRQDTYGQKNPVQFTKVHCTACNVHLGSALDGQGNRFVHPLLKVLICKNCYFFYSSGEFERDEDGSELYCRWCGQGGQVMCCSKCEMVFCKKCIRINFDRKKIADIRDSDDWLCFRCNPSQITHLKIHCAEFMEYVRRERSRAATLENYAAFTNTDHALCCQSLKKKATDSPAEQPKRKRRKAAVVDPDYNPLKDEEDDHNVIEKVPHTITPTPAANATSTPRTPPAVPPRANGVPSTPVAQQVRPGVTPYRPKGPQQQFRPRLQTAAQNAASMQSQRPAATSSPGYIKILPGGVVVPGNAPRQVRVMTPRPQPPTIRQQTPTQTMVRPRAQGSMAQTQAQSQTKHEWFEKTVRAAARVNSNLSYTLTNLNRAQAAATSVEALAVVHNKLQEILSTSINSLIQIRKNLRAEFIQGIKNARFPQKPQPPVTSTTPTTSSSKTCDQDDDVIIISPASSPVPAAKASPALNTNRPSTSRSVDSGRGGGVRPFLRVKSLTALQNVTAECITIPDDPPEIEKPIEVGIDAKKKGLDTTKVIKVDITKILAGEDPVVESSSSKEKKSKEADKNDDEAVIIVSEPENTEGKFQDEKDNGKSIGGTALEELSERKKKTEEEKSKDKSNLGKKSEKKESGEKKTKETSEEKTKEKISVGKTSVGKESEEKKTKESSEEKESEEKKTEGTSEEKESEEKKTEGTSEKKTKEKSNAGNTSKEKESAENKTDKMSEEEKTKDKSHAEITSDEKQLEKKENMSKGDKTNVDKASEGMESEEKEVVSEEEPTKSSSKRSSPELEPLQGFKSMLERSDKKECEQEAMSEEEPMKSSSNRSSPALKALQDCKVVLERSKEIEGCVTKNQKTD